jgi:hypothetical protein
MKQKGKKSAEEEKHSEKTPHTTNSQRLSIIQLLRNESNFRLITGAAAQNAQVVSGKKLKKVDACRSLANFVTHESNISWTTDQAKHRYESYLSLYKKAKLYLLYVFQDHRIFNIPMQFSMATRIEEMWLLKSISCVDRTVPSNESVNCSKA